MVCLETRHVRAAMSAQRNKTDPADALGIAHIMRTGWFRAATMRPFTPALNAEECTAHKPSNAARTSTIAGRAASGHDPPVE